MPEISQKNIDDCQGQIDAMKVEMFGRLKYILDRIAELSETINYMVRYNNLIDRIMKVEIRVRELEK
jgi:hypothetical protein